MKEVRIAILGATGLIGRSLTNEARQRNYDATVFSRDSRKATEKFTFFGIEHGTVLDYDDFEDRYFDVIVNATGVGSPREINKDPTQVFKVTENIDSLILSYLEKYPQSRVFNLSSGSVYGRSADRPIQSVTQASFEVSHLHPGDFYSLAKLYSEAKHRSVPERHIIDLRVYAFVSRFLDLEESFFIAEVVKCLKVGTVFKTKPEDMTRDYATAEDLWDIIGFLMTLPPQNAAFDVRSAGPVSKFELLKHLSERFGLKYETGQIVNNSPTGEKSAYYSESKTLNDLGYSPKRSALQNIETELEFILS